MRQAKFTFWIVFICGIMVLLAGIFMKISNQVSTGYHYSRYTYGDNTAYGQTIDGFSAIILGIFLLIVSAFCFYSYKKEKKKWDSWTDEEELPKKKGRKPKQK